MRKLRRFRPGFGLRGAHSLLCGLAVLYVAVPETGAQETDQPTALAVAEAFLDAFNNHDPVAISALVRYDFESFEVDTQGEATRNIYGRSEFFEEMTDYFAEHPVAQATFTEPIDGPVYVALRQQISGEQTALAVYEVRNGLVRRVWRFPPGISF